MISVARTTVLILLTLLALVLVWIFLEPILVVLLALFVSASLRPYVERLQKRGLPAGVSVGLVYLTVALGMISVVLLIIGPLQRDAQNLMTRLAQVYEQIMTTWPTSESEFRRSIAERLPSSDFIYTMLAGQTNIPFLQGLAGILSSIGSVVGKGVVILILSLYWSTDHVRFERLWLTSLPVSARVRTRRIWQDIEQGVGTLIRSLVAEGATSALLLWIGLWLLGVPYAGLLAVIGGVVQIIPWLSIVLAVLPVLMVASIAPNPITGLIGVVYTLAVTVIFELYIQPHYFPRNQTSSLLLFVTAIVLTLQIGLVGLIVSPAVAMMLQVLWSHLADPARDRMTPVGSTPAELQANYAVLMASMNAVNGEMAPETRSLVNKLGELMRDAETMMNSS